MRAGRLANVASCRVASRRGRVRRRVTREDSELGDWPDMDERGHVVNFYGEKNLTSRQTRGPDLPSGFPFLFDMRTRSLYPLILAAPRSVYQCEPRRKPDIDRILREARVAVHRPLARIESSLTQTTYEWTTWMDDINRVRDTLSPMLSVMYT